MVTHGNSCFHFCTRRAALHGLEDADEGEEHPVIEPMDGLLFEHDKLPKERLRTKLLGLTRQTDNSVMRLGSDQSKSIAAHAATK